MSVCNSSFKLERSLAISGTFIATSASSLNAFIVIFIAYTSITSRSMPIPRLLVLGLAITDMGYGVFSAIPVVVRYWLGYCAAGGKAVCTMQGFMDNLFSVCSLLVVFTMSWERFIAIRMPFRYGAICTLRNTLLVLASIFCISLLNASMPLMGVNEYACNSFCDFDWSATDPVGRGFVYIKVLLGLTVMVILLCLNAAVVVEVIRMRKKKAPGGKQDGQADEKSMQTQFVMLILVISVLFVICNAPFLIRMWQYQLQIENPPVGDTTIKRMYLTNNIIDPIICVVFYMGQYQRQLFKRLRACFSCCRSAHVEPMATNTTVSTLTNENAQHMTSKTSSASEPMRMLNP